MSKGEVEKKNKKRRCTKCNAPFLIHHHKHITRKGIFHTGCYREILPTNQKQNYLQVGRTLACGACHPGKFENCKEVAKKYPEFKCDCICHDKKSPNPPQLNTLIEEKLKLFDKKFYEAHNWVEINDHIATVLQQAIEGERERILKDLPKEVEVGFVQEDPLARWRDTPSQECLKYCDEAYNCCLSQVKRVIKSPQKPI